MYWRWMPLKGAARVKMQKRLKRRTKETQAIFKIFREVAPEFKYDPDTTIYSYRDKLRHALKIYDTQRDRAKARRVWKKVLTVMKKKGIIGYELLDSRARGLVMSSPDRISYVSGIKKHY